MTTERSPLPLLTPGAGCFLAGVCFALWTILLGGLAEYYGLWDGRPDPLLLFFFAVFLSGTTVAFLTFFLMTNNHGASGTAAKE